jgi:hypothetical protein
MEGAPIDDQAALGESTFDAAWQAGRGMSPGDTIAYALENAESA